MRRGGAVRSLVFSTFALVPVIGVLYLAVVWLGHSSDRQGDLREELATVEDTAVLNSNRNALAGAVHLFQVASIPGASDSAIVAAEETRQNFGFARQDVERVVESVEQVAESDWTEPQDQSTLLRALIVEAAMSQQIGAPVGEDLLGLERAVGETLMSAVIPSLLVQVDELNSSANTLLALLRLDADYDADLRRVLSNVDHSHTISTADLDSTQRVGAIQWDREQQIWTMRLVGVEAVTAVTRPETVVDDPIVNAFLDFERASTPAERGVAMDRLLAVDAELNVAVGLATESVMADFKVLDAQIGNERVQAYVTLGVMLVLGLALVGSSWQESRGRRRVEHAHTEALNSMAEKAYRDPLTDLRNRRWLDETLAERLECLDDSEEVHLVYLDLDSFKAINDVWGHESGDRVLEAVADCLHEWSATHAGWDFARFGGDEFIALIDGERLQDRFQIQALLNEIGDLRIDHGSADVPVQIQASAGVSTGRRGSRGSDLLLAADSALGLSKRRYRGSVSFYDPLVSRTGELLPLLPAALESDEIRVAVQPIIDLSTGEVAHVEALARWYHPTGVIWPAEFVPLAEMYGLTYQLTKAIMRDVCRIRHAHPDLPRVWINVSPVELAHSEFASRFLDAISASGLRADEVGIEVTESAAIRDVEDVAQMLQTVRWAGVQVAIDDFGAGYTPLGYLRTLPIDIIKIDRALITMIDEDLANQEIVSGIVRMAHRLGMDVVAEGVERVEELTWLRSVNVRYAQGYLLGHPGSVDDMVTVRHIDEVGSLTAAGSVSIN